MNTIFKYTFAAVVAIASLAACQEFQDFDKTQDAAPGLGFVQTGTDNLYTVKVIHHQTESTGEFSTEFPVRCNTTLHGDATATAVYDASLVEAYNTEHKTTYATLPEEYLKLENTTVTMPANALSSIDSVKVTLTGDFSRLTERSYLAPMRIETSGIGTSVVKNAVYVVVKTEINLLKPITSANEITGFPAMGRSKWSANCDNSANLFDNNTSTSATSKAKESGNVLDIDMKQKQLITGLSLGMSTSPTIEYSLDGETYLQAGTPASGEYISASSKMHMSFYKHIEARYLRLIFSSTSQNLSEVDIYKLDSDQTAVYAQTGTDNVITGKITHKQSSSISTSNLNASFSAFVTAASASGYSVKIASDNTLVSAYNSANGTSYTALPAQYLQLSNAELSIAANTTKSTTDATVALTGDLTKLTDTNGYLAALKLTSSGATTSESRGVVYVVVNVEFNKIRRITSIDQLEGFSAAERSAWSADCANYANIFDSNTSSSVGFSNQANNVVTVDMKATRKVTGIQLNSHGFSSVSFEYSTDGQNFLTAGTTTSGEHVTSGSDYYIALMGHIEARFLRMTISFSSSRNKSINEFNIYQIESLEPTIYAECGKNNVISGGVFHTPAGSFNGLDASFNVYTTIASATGFSVSAEVDNTLIAAYNSAHGTSYVALPSGNRLIENSLCTIAANSKKSATQVKVSLKGDLTKLTNKNGYIVPLQLGEATAAISSDRGVVYVVITPTSEIFRKNFTQADISGTPVADRSGWTITGGDYHSGSWPEVIDGNTNTFMRPWGSPVNWTINLGKEYEMTGLVITARTDNASYQGYQPTGVLIEYSNDGVDYTELGTPTNAAGNLVKAVPSSYVALYGSQKMRYIRITATYNSNMGIGEFNIYTK